MTTSETRLHAERLADRISELEYVADTIRLPDFHLKDGMEAPSSFVVASRDVIVPHLVSEAINDGMGLLTTPFTVDDVDPRRLDGVLQFVNAAGARTKLSTTRYSWTPDLLEAACRSGAEPLLKHYGLDPAFSDAIEDQGRATVQPLSRDEFKAAVPALVRGAKVVRGEVGLNFGGNHFLEIQAVERIIDHDLAERFGVAQGQIVVMYHLGPGTLGSILSNLYARRQKPPLHRKIGYAAARHALHLSTGRGFYKTFARSNSWLSVEETSEQGRALRDVLRIVKNCGFAYRMATVRCIADAVSTVLDTDLGSIKLVVDASHNMLQPEDLAGETFWVSRHNCCRPRPGMPGIVAGTHQVESYLIVGLPGSDTRLAGYDHGVGFLVDHAIGAALTRPDPSGHQVQRLSMTRGTNDVHSRKSFPLLDPSIAEEAINDLERAGFVRPVAVLRPLTTLKHVV